MCMRVCEFVYVPVWVSVCMWVDDCVCVVYDCVCVVYDWNITVTFVIHTASVLHKLEKVLTELPEQVQYCAYALAVYLKDFHLGR